MELRHLLRQEQILTPQLILNLKLLQLPTIELEQLIEAELEQNPALEPAEEINVEAPHTEPVESPLANEEEPVLKGEEGLLIDTAEEFSLNELIPSDAWEVPSGEYLLSSNEALPGEEYAPNPVATLREALLPRLQAEVLPEDAGIAEQVVEWLNEDGFLTVRPEELAETLGVEIERVKRVLSALSQIPPGGFGCSGVKEALLAQLELKGYPPEALECRLLREGWELLKNKQLDKLVKVCNASEEEVREAVKRILNLEPRPGRQFTTSAVNYITPDFSVEWREDKLVVVVQDETIPRLRVSRRFLEILAQPKNFSKEQVEFAREKVRRAMMFLKAIESRRNLLRRLVDFILQRQKDFFSYGPEHLKPTTLQDAADFLKVHPATVSRAISGKYLETNYGIFSLKYFFKGGTGDKSRESIKEKIRLLIENEDKQKPLKDEEICLKLKEEGINISRRTVTKYRSELGIPGAEGRKRL
ncbi:MAG: RNA polymerase factor sigma-54 [candidate division WOR-3 bacterium]